MFQTEQQGLGSLGQNVVLVGAVGVGHEILDHVPRRLGVAETRFAAPRVHGRLDSVSELKGFVLRGQVQVLQQMLR